MSLWFGEESVASSADGFLQLLQHPWMFGAWGFGAGDTALDHSSQAPLFGLPLLIVLLHMEYPYLLSLQRHCKPLLLRTAPPAEVIAVFFSDGTENIWALNRRHASRQPGEYAQVTVLGTKCRRSPLLDAPFFHSISYPWDLCP